MIKTTGKALLLTLTLALPMTLSAEAGKCGMGKCGGAMKNTKKTTMTNAQINDENMKAAYTLLDTMHMADNYNRMTKQITDMQIAQAPQLSVVRDTIQNFFDKYMGWNAIKKDIAALYAKNYTKEELKKMNDFFASDVGQKYIALTPKIAAASAQIGQSKLQGHMGELKKMIDEKLAALPKKKK
jgi:hypothetical protein